MEIGPLWEEEEAEMPDRDRRSEYVACGFDLGVREDAFSCQAAFLASAMVSLAAFEAARYCCRWFSDWSAFSYAFLLVATTLATS